MFTEFQNQAWTPSDPSVVVTDNTDTSIDGSCKKIVWTDAQNESVVISFDEIDLSSWEEISLHIFMKDQLVSGSVFRFTIDGEDFDFTKKGLQRAKWNHILFNCSGMGAVSEIVITSLIENLVLMVDYIGYRKVTHNADADVVEALKSHINLNYDVSTTLAEDADYETRRISLTDKTYINDTSTLELDDGAGTTEIVELLSRNGTISEELMNSFSAGDEVRVLCPVRGEDYDSIEPDPLCGIKVFDVSPMKEDSILLTKNGVKLKQYLGNLGILIYIDCRSKSKLMQLRREYEFKYGEEFQFLLDGEKVDIYLDSSLFADRVIGNNPRMAYYYRVQPQPYLVVDFGYTEDLTLNVESKHPKDI